jgi:exonuclease III
MRILSWNMQHRAIGWDWLANESDFDVALLQEAKLPSWIREKYPNVFYRRIPEYQEWGTAFISKSDSFTEFVPEQDHFWLNEMLGPMVLAMPKEESGIWFCSIHSHYKPIPTEKLVEKPIPNLLEAKRGVAFEIDVIAHFLKPILSSKRFIFGGDLNSSLLIDKNQGYSNNRRLFENLEAMGYLDLRNDFYEEEQQTYYKSGNGPFQLDHLYSDAATKATVSSWRVLSEVVTLRNLSDHASIEVVTA